MGHQSAMKDLRKQIRNVVQEQFPAILSVELATAIRTDLQDKLSSWMLDNTMKISKALSEMDQRSKDVQTFVLRQASNAAAPTLPDTETKASE